MSNLSRNTKRWIRMLGSAAAVCIVAAACGGGSINVKGGQQGLSDLNADDYANESDYGEEESVNRTLDARQREVNGEKRIYFYREGSDTPILWATVHDKGGLMFRYTIRGVAKRYTVDYTSLQEKYQPRGGAGSLIVGGEMPAGAKVGIGALEMGDDTGPYMVTVLGQSDREFENKKAGELILARCGSQACEDVPSGGETYEIKEGTKKIIETTTLGVNRVTDDGAINWSLSTYNRAKLTAAEGDGWGQNGDLSSGSGNSDFDDKWKDLPEYNPEPSDPQPSSSSSNNNNEEEEGGFFSNFFSMDTLKTAALVIGGGILAWQTYQLVFGDGTFFDVGPGSDTKNLGNKLFKTGGYAEDEDGDVDSDDSSSSGNNDYSSTTMARWAASCEKSGNCTAWDHSDPDNPTSSSMF